MHPFRKFIKQFTQFFAGSIAVQLFSFITFPIFTRVLTKEQYGILGLITTVMFFGIAVAKAGLSDGIIRFYQDYSKNPEKKSEFASTVLSRGFVLSGLTSLAYTLLFLMFQNRLEINKGYVACFLIMALYLFLNPLNIIVLRFLRVNDRTLLLNVLDIVGRSLSVGLSLIFLIYLFREFYGYFIGVVAAEMIMAGILFYWFFKNYRITPSVISGELHLKMIKFGVPLFLTELTFLLDNYSDRFLVVAFLGEEALGTYTVGENIAMYIANIVIFSLSYAMVPISVQIYGEEGREKTEMFMQKCLKYLVIAILPMWFGYVAVSKELITILASEKYAVAATFSPLILLASFIGTLNVVFGASFYLKKKTMLTFLIEFSSIPINIGLNLILIKRLQFMGACIAALVSIVVSTTLMIVVSRRYFRIGIEVSSLLYYVGVSCIMFLVVTQINTGMISINLILKVITGTVLVALAILFKENEIRENIKKYLGGRSDKGLQLG
jgi:O-antigen/teichoic acid export membrane protein